MGVPSFFRWLQRKYPSIIVNAVEERKNEINGTEIPVDCTKPNPNYQVCFLGEFFRLIISYFLGI